MTKNLLLVIPPSSRFKLTDEHIEDLIFRILETRRITPAEAAMVQAAVLAGGPLGKAATNFYLPARVHSNMDLLRKLVVGIYESDPKLETQGLLIVQEGADFLKSLTFLGEARHETGIAYARHPHDQHAYVRLADFHRYLLDEKRREFLTLAMNLGAKSICVHEEQRKTENRRAHAKAGIPTQAGPAEAEFRVQKSQAGADYFNLFAEFDPPASAPFITPGLRWFESEPQWKAMADARTGTASALRMNVSFRYNSDYSVSADIAAKVASIGISAGGEFKKASLSEVDYEVEFFPKPNP